LSFKETEKVQEEEKGDIIREPSSGFKRLSVSKKEDKEESTSTASSSEPVMVSPQKNVHENLLSPNYHLDKEDWKRLKVVDPIRVGENCPMGVQPEIWDTLTDWIEPDLHVNTSHKNHLEEIKKLSRNFSLSKEQICKNIDLDYKRVMEEIEKRSRVRHATWQQKILEEEKLKQKAQKRYRKQLNKEVYGISGNGVVDLTDSEEELLSGKIEKEKEEK
jgi:hypothetical protein